MKHTTIVCMHECMYACYMLYVCIYRIYLMYICMYVRMPACSIMYVFIVY